MTITLIGHYLARQCAVPLYNMQLRRDASIMSEKHQPASLTAVRAGSHDTAHGTEYGTAHSTCARHRIWHRARHSCIHEHRRSAVPRFPTVGQKPRGRVATCLAKRAVRYASLSRHGSGRTDRASALQPHRSQSLGSPPAATTAPHAPAANKPRRRSPCTRSADARIRHIRHIHHSR